MGESQGELEPHFGEKEAGSEREDGKERVDFTVKKGRFQGGEEGQAKSESLHRRSRRRHKRVSGRKSSPERSAQF